MIEVSCSGSEKFRLQVKPKTKTGSPATIETGSLVVVAVDGEEGDTGTGENPVAVVENADTFSVQADRPADAEPGALVTQRFLVSGDADVGAGVETISEVVELTVTLDKADNLGVTLLGAVART